MEQIVSFPGLGFSIPVNPDIVCLGNFCIKWYGAIIAVGFLCAVLYINKNTVKFGLDNDRVMDVVLGSILVGIIGARLYYVAFSWDLYRDDPISILHIWNGGLAIYGGVIFGIIACLIFCKIRKVRVLPTLDLFSAGLILGQGIGRWGNFCNGEAFGRATNMPWRMNITYASSSMMTEAEKYLAGLPSEQIMEMGGMENIGVHPTFFYESVWCILGFLLLWWMRDRRMFDGQLILTYAIWYGTERFVVEGLRTDSLMIGNLRVSQLVALLSAVAAAIILVVVLTKKKSAHDPEYLKLYVDTEEAQLIREGRFYGKKKKKEEGSSENGEVSAEEAAVTGEEADAQTKTESEEE